MAQIFRPRSNIILVTCLVVMGSAFLIFFLSAPTFQTSDFLTQVGDFRSQVVPFSHKHHSGQLGIDCRFCHQNVEQSSFAGMPTASVCMHCHSQIWTEASMLEPIRAAYATDAPLFWSRVHKLPDYVFFNHSIHVQKGIGCVSCHGNISDMPLMRKTATLQMEWCLECHRNPERFVRPSNEVFNMAYVAPDDQGELGRKLVRDFHIQKKTDCYTCHR